MKSIPHFLISICSSSPVISAVLSGHIDVMPTLAEIAGAKLPEDVAETADCGELGAFPSCVGFFNHSQLVTHSSDRANQLAVGTLIDFFPEIIDIDIHHIRHGVKGKIPDVLNNHGAGHPASGL